jgi:hypothetical protein
MVRRIFIRSLSIAAAVALAGGLWVALHTYVGLHARMQTNGAEIYTQVTDGGSELARREVAEMLRFAEEPRSFGEIVRQSMGYGSFWALFLPVFVALFALAFLGVYFTLLWRERHRLLDDD